MSKRGRKEVLLKEKKVLLRMEDSEYKRLEFYKDKDNSMSELLRFVIKIGIDRLEEGVGENIKKILKEEVRIKSNEKLDMEVIEGYIRGELGIEEEEDY